MSVIFYWWDDWVGEGIRCWTWPRAQAPGIARWVQRTDRLPQLSSSLNPHPVCTPHTYTKIKPFNFKQNLCGFPVNHTGALLKESCTHKCPWDNFSSLRMLKSSGVQIIFFMVVRVVLETKLRESCMQCPHSTSEIHSKPHSVSSFLKDLFKLCVCVCAHTHRDQRLQST